MKGDENGQFANIKTEHFLNVCWEICEAHIVDILIEKVAHLVKPGITDEDIGDFAGAANQEVGKGKAEEHWLQNQTGNNNIMSYTINCPSSPIPFCNPFKWISLGPRNFEKLPGRKK